VLAARAALRADPVRRDLERPISLPILFAVAALLGVARAFAGRRFGALAPNLVPRELLPRAIALSSTAWQAGAIAGPALGGILYDVTPHLPTASARAVRLLGTRACS
jgi:MFS family permease